MITLSASLGKWTVTTPREHYLRGGEVYNTSLTGDAIARIADWLDIADSKTRTAVYPEMPKAKTEHELCLAWCWAALLVANMVEADSATLRMLAQAIKGIESEE